MSTLFNVPLWAILTTEEFSILPLNSKTVLINSVRVPKSRVPQVFKSWEKIFHSEMADAMLERIGDVSKGLPRKRICVPEQMDSTLLFLVSPSSECVTGTCIKIDDGQTAR